MNGSLPVSQYQYQKVNYTALDSSYLLWTMQEMTLHLNDFCSNVINNARTPFLETKKPLHLNGISTTYSAKIQEWKPKGKAKDESLNETENCLSIYSLLYN